MMKLQFEVTHVEQAAGRLTLKPINCALNGEVIYNLPNRALAGCQVGSVTDAVVSLPDQYPINGTNYHIDDPLKHEHKEHWRPIKTAPAGIWLLVCAPDVSCPGGTAGGDRAPDSV
jgi:hypothetical protein